MHSMNNPLSLEQTGTINMHIITVSRQFGSGGRELGKRLSDLLGWDYYDKEIIETLADEHNMDPKQVRRVLSHHGWHDLQLTYNNSFSHLGFDHGTRTRLLVRQREIIQSSAGTRTLFFRIITLSVSLCVQISQPGPGAV